MYYGLSNDHTELYVLLPLSYMVIGQLCNKDTLADYNIMYIVIIVVNGSI